MKRIEVVHPAAKTPTVNTQVIIDCQRLPVPFTYTGNSIYHRGICGGSAMGPRRTGERDCRGLRKILRGGKRTGENRYILNYD